jgi:hypothetical protein
MLYENSMFAMYQTFERQSHCTCIKKKYSESLVTSGIFFGIPGICDIRAELWSYGAEVDVS